MQNFKSLSSNYDSYLLSKAFYSLHREVLNQDYQVPDTSGDPDQSLDICSRPNDKDFPQGQASQYIASWQPKQNALHLLAS